MLWPCAVMKIVYILWRHISERKLFYLERGHGQPVVLIHRSHTLNGIRNNTVPGCYKGVEEHEDEHCLQTVLSTSRIYTHRRPNISRKGSYFT